MRGGEREPGRSRNELALVIEMRRLDRVEVSDPPAPEATVKDLAVVGVAAETTPATDAPNGPSA